MRNKLFSYLGISAVAVAALLVPSARAQIETFDTISSFGLEGSDATYGFGPGGSLTQTFQNVLQVNDMTYQFVAQGSSSVTTDLSAYLVQWNPDTNKAINGTTLFSQSYTIPPTNNSQGGWNNVQFNNQSGTYSAYNLLLNVNSALLDPSSTYAMILINTGSASSNVALEDIFNEYPFTSDGTVNGTPYGNAYSLTKTQNSGNAVTLASLSTKASNAANDGVWGFSQIDVIPAGNTTPEPRTAAVALCGLFVAILMGRHLYQNRKLLAGATLA